MITVLTPTYNRKELLSVLYQSLCQQTDKNFTWLIMDDGSTDGTSEIIEEFQKNVDFNIHYELKKNGGKHTALNHSYQFISSTLTFIVDSDDWLKPYAIASIKKVYRKYKDERDVCGFSFLRGKLEGGYLSDAGVSKNGLKESFVECRINRGIGGDMAEVWYTKCLKECPFPEFEGEKFLGEDVVWIRLSEKYKMRFFNKVIYISDYLEDGLTKKRRKYNIESPKGCVVRAEAFLESDANMKAKVRAMLQYCIYGRFAGMSQGKLWIRSKNKLFYIVFFLPAHFLYWKWKIENRKLLR